MPKCDRYKYDTAWFENCSLPIMVFNLVVPCAVQVSFLWVDLRQQPEFAKAFNVSLKDAPTAVVLSPRCAACMFASQMPTMNTSQDPSSAH